MAFMLTIEELTIEELACWYAYPYIHTHNKAYSRKRSYDGQAQGVGFWGGVSITGLRLEKYKVSIETTNQLLSLSTAVPVLFVYYRLQSQSRSTPCG